MTQGGFIFKKSILEKVLQGKKTMTIRYNGGFDEGKTYAVRANMNEKAKARILIIKKQKKKLGDLTPEDIAKEGCKSFEEFQQIWERLYGKWNPEDTVFCYEFILVKPWVSRWGELTTTRRKERIRDFVRTME